MHADDRAIPTLPCLDLDEALAFYERLGFACPFAQRMPDVYAILVLGSVELHLWGCDDAHVAENSGCYLRVADADAWFRAATAAAVPRLGRIEDKPWGMREFHLFDPSGNILRIGNVIAPPSDRRR